MSSCCVGRQDYLDVLKGSVFVGSSVASVSGTIALITTLVSTILGTSSFLGTTMYITATVASSVFLLSIALVVIGGVGLLALHFSNRS